MKSLKAKIAIGSSVQPNIILLHFILIKKFTAGLIAFSASLILGFVTSLIALLVSLIAKILLGFINLNFYQRTYYKLLCF